MVYTLRFFSSKCSLFHNSNVFGSCIIQFYIQGVLKLKKFRRQTVNPLVPNDYYNGRTAPLTSKCCISYIYSPISVLNILTRYILFVFSPSKCSLFHNSNAFESCIIHILYKGCAKIKNKSNSGAKRLKHLESLLHVSILKLLAKVTFLKTLTD